MIESDLARILEKAMNGSSLRHSVLANNIANVNTPGFKRSDVNFRSTLEEAVSTQLRLKRTNPLHMGTNHCCRRPEIFSISETSMRNDGNNVDVDVELATLAENNLYFNSLAQLLSSQLSLIKQAIAEGRR